jgi:hypothetical protein
MQNRSAWLVPLTVVLVVGCVPSAWAQKDLDTDNGRYTLSTTADGVLRLDTRTGQVSTCVRKQGSWACYAVPDERAALEAEIGRISEENRQLKQALAANPRPGELPGKIEDALPKADSLKPDASDGQKSARAPNRLEIPLPSDADVERAMNFLEKVWRRLVEMAGRVQKDISDRI